jgi:hypothetical protein
MLSASSKSQEVKQEKGEHLDLVAIISQLKNERDRINRAIAALDGASNASESAGRKVANGRKGGMSPEGRRRIFRNDEETTLGEHRKKAKLKG